MFDVVLDVLVWDKPLRGFFRWPRAAPFVTWSRLRRRKTPRQLVEKGDETMIGGFPGTCRITLMI